MHEQSTYHVALPIGRRDDGRLVQDHNAAVECPSADFAVELAQMMSVHPGYVGSIAFSRIAIPELGSYSEPVILARCGHAAWADELI